MAVALPGLSGFIQDRLAVHCPHAAARVEGLLRAAARELVLVVRLGGVVPARLELKRVRRWNKQRVAPLADHVELVLPPFYPSLQLAVRVLLEVHATLLHEREEAVAPAAAPGAVAALLLAGGAARPGAGAVGHAVAPGLAALYKATVVLEHAPPVGRLGSLRSSTHQPSEGLVLAPRHQLGVHRLREFLPVVQGRAAVEHRGPHLPVQLRLHVLQRVLPLLGGFRGCRVDRTRRRHGRAREDRPPSANPRTALLRDRPPRQGAE
mmetsp:Transcript_41371/g.111125  ORF Transcript_41371/g.111125 Transcript_41371/m.111125 type:complete len:265 (+) Transcript_41371:128-922(+)